MGNPIAIGFPAPGTAESEMIEYLPLQFLDIIGGSNEKTEKIEGGPEYQRPNGPHTLNTSNT